MFPFFFFFPFFLASVDAEAEAAEQHPAVWDLLQVAPLVLAEAEAPLLQHPAVLLLSQVAPLASVEAEAPLLQQLVVLLLSQVFSQEAFLASLEQVCSVFAFLSAGASVDCALAVKAKMAKAPRKRNFFMRVFLSITNGRVVGLECQDTKSLACWCDNEEISLFLSPVSFQREARGTPQERCQSGNGADC